MRNLVRPIAALFAIVSLLFMQLAVASYVCPQLSTTAAQTMTMPPDCAGNLDPEQPLVCKAHCEVSAQSIDKLHAPEPTLDAGPAIPSVAFDVREASTARHVNSHLSSPVARGYILPLYLKFLVLRN